MMEKRVDLPRAVRPDQRDPLPEIDTQGDVLEKRARAKAFRDFRQGKHKRASIGDAGVHRKPGGRGFGGFDFGGEFEDCFYFHGGHYRMAAKKALALHPLFDLIGLKSCFLL